MNTNVFATKETILHYFVQAQTLKDVLVTLLGFLCLFFHSKAIPTLRNAFSSRTSTAFTQMQSSGLTTADGETQAILATQSNTEN